VILDEEQRFGVAQKELLRSLRLELDVLTLTATPIPRTLHMSLPGLRDISIIETPPEERRPIRTNVAEYDEDMIQPALERAHARLATLADHTELGAGFAIATRDLEIRGAGELLGAEQSGHVAAVGFELYVELLNEAVAELQGQRRIAARPVRVDARIDAYVPQRYVGSEALRIDIHRRLALAETDDELRELAAALEDRYGPLPDP